MAIPAIASAFKVLIDDKIERDESTKWSTQDQKYEIYIFPFIIYSIVSILLSIFITFFLSFLY